MFGSLQGGRNERVGQVSRVIRVNVVNKFRVCMIGVCMDGPGVSGNE